MMNCWLDSLRERGLTGLTLLLGLFQQVLKGIPVSMALRIQALLDSFLAGVLVIMRLTLLIPAWKY